MLVLRLQLLEALVLRRKVVFLVLPCHRACRVRGWGLGFSSLLDCCCALRLQMLPLLSTPLLVDSAVLRAGP